jgi:hypothetical protein
MFEKAIQQGAPQANAWGDEDIAGTAYQLCKCGQYRHFSGSEYAVVQYGKDGEIVFASCVHGCVVIDKEEEDEEK